MIEKGMEAFRGKQVLLLQGPIGPFFKRLARDLENVGAQVHKVNFNGGDWLFSSSGAINYRNGVEEWPAFFESLIEELGIDVVMLFGDCRPIHRVAHDIARSCSIEIGVFEEGYIRPDYVTLERFGVNNNSLIPRIPEFYLKNPIAHDIDRPARVGNTFSHAMIWAILYYLACGLLKPFFSQYRHHRSLSWLEAFPWLRAFWRKYYYALREYGALTRITNNLDGRFFLVPLQVHNDAQIHDHSDFDSSVHFIESVMESFSKHAPQDAALVIKHHPMDRGHLDYTALISARSRDYGLAGRCIYIHDQHLPTLLQHARGVVVINSTVGLSALHHERPLKVCGNAIYDLPGLTFQGPLDDFWVQAQQHFPDRTLLHSFQNYLVSRTQLNGNFYKRLSDAKASTGMRWTSNEHHRKSRAVAIDIEVGQTSF